MKLVTFRDSSGLRCGLVEGSSIIDLGMPGDVHSVIASGLAADLPRAKAREDVASKTRKLSDVELTLPIARPGKILCLGLNYREHVKEGPYEIPDYPTIFMRGATSLVAHGQPIVRPLISDKLDFEAELAVIIGKTVRHVTKQDALEAVFGYACFNDATLRDYQKRTVQWTVGKNFDSTGGFGPWIVTADALPPGAEGLNIESRLNGVVMQSDNTRNMMFPVAETIATISAAITLEPGDMIVMGTPSGVGYARKPPIFMKAGDVVEIEIEGIGTLRNPVVDEARR
jgi:acylpyruvate hydrolase